MNNLVRWEPFREMTRFMDRWMADAWAPSMAVNGGRHSLPAVDVYQTDDAVVVKAEVPGLKAEDLEISIDDNVLTIKGEVRQERSNNGDKERKHYLREMRYASYCRKMSLPLGVKADEADAELQDGILTLTLPKADEAKPKTIEVKPMK